MKDILLCKDCKYHYRSLGHIITFVNYHECRHEKSYQPPKVSLITGPEKKGYILDCGTMRNYPDKCGIEAKLWSPKNTKKFLFTVLKKEQL